MKALKLIAWAVFTVLFVVFALVPLFWFLVGWWVIGVVIWLVLAVVYAICMVAVRVWRRVVPRR